MSEYQRVKIHTYRYLGNEEREGEDDGLKRDDKNYGNNDFNEIGKF
jgi:hypothetical protein